MRLLLSGVALTLVMVDPGLRRARRHLPRRGKPVPVTIQGYHGDAMEPFVSPDGKYLFFNNRNDAGTDTNLYFARRVNDTTFSYGGADRRRQQSALDAVASIDAIRPLLLRVHPELHAARSQRSTGGRSRTDGSPTSRSFRACRRPHPDGSISTPT